MKRTISTPRNQLALYLEPKQRHPLETQTREALITTLADLLLEAYAIEEDTETGEQGGHHES